MAVSGCHLRPGGNVELEHRDTISKTTWAEQLTPEHFATLRDLLLKLNDATKLRSG